MKRQHTVGQQITFGFGLLLLALAALAVWSVHGISGIVDNAKQVIAGNQLRGETVQKELDHMNWACQVTAVLTDADVTTLDVQTDPHKCAFGQWYYSEARREAEELVPALTEDLAAIEQWHSDLHASAVEIGKTFEQADLTLSAVLQQRKVDHLGWAHKVKDVFVDSNLPQAEVQEDPHRCAFGQWLDSEPVTQLREANPEFDRIWIRVQEPHRNLHSSATHINQLLAEGRRSDAAVYYKQTTDVLAAETCGMIDEMIAWNDARVHAMQRAQNIFATQTKPCLAKVQHYLANMRQKVLENIMTDEQMLLAATQTRLGVTATSILAGIAGIAVAAFIVLGIKRVLSRIVACLNEGAEQVAAASGQVSAASQSLAEGATEQAAGLEETSSSLEEMASMTRQSAENAQQANALATEAHRAADTGSQAMQRMDSAIKEIQRSSGETAKIIKVIDEIAFQTNLLALNAAVEAARAGEAGKGFAVVAEEVRNLAMRSAEAAKNTACMIEESVKNSKNGVSIAGEVREVLDEIVGSISKTTDLVSEIAAASGEQAQGIDQVNTAVAQMDKVTQQNAANAEESASASEELSSQAESMRELVAELTALVGGAGVCERQTSPARQGRKLAVADRTWHRIAAGSGRKAKSTTDSVASGASTFASDGPGDDLGDFNV